MDDRFQTFVSRTENYRAFMRAQSSKPRGPLQTAIFTLLSIIIFLALLVLIIPIMALILLFGVGFTLYLAAKRFVARIGKPNNTIAGVRTDGRDNVRVIERE